MHINMQYVEVTDCPNRTVIGHQPQICRSFKTHNGYATEFYNKVSSRVIFYYVYGIFPNELLVAAI